VEVDGDYVVDTSDVKEVCNHTSGNSTTVLLLFRLPRVREVWHNRYMLSVSGLVIDRAIRSSGPVTDFAEPPLQAEIIIKSSMTESLILRQLACARVFAQIYALLAAALDDEDIFVTN
jgi:hypothetical protein